MKRNQFGLNAEDFNIIRTFLFEPLQRAGCKVAIFGSRARGDYRPFSDLDVLVDGEVSSATLSVISEALEESNLPIRVDIVTERDLADTYRAQVRREMILVPSFVTESS